MPNSEDSFGSSLTDEIALLPCPFCGGDELSHGHSYPPALGNVECHSCDMTIFGETEAKAIEKWNLRTSPVPAPAPTGWEPVAEVFTMEALVPGGYVRHHVRLLKKLPAGTKLYVAPAVEVV